MNKRVFAHYILYEGQIYKNTILEIRDSNIRLFPFKEEIAGTVFFSGIILVCNVDISRTHLCSLLKIYKSSQDFSMKSEEIRCYLKDNNLYPVSKSKMAILFYEAEQLTLMSL